MVRTSPDWLSPGIDGGKREDPRPFPQFNPREERLQSLWRVRSKGETTRKLSRPTPPSPVQITTPSEGAGRGVPRGPRSFPAAARAHTHKDAAPSHPAPHITHPSWPFFSLRPGRAAPGQPAAVATSGGAQRGAARRRRRMRRRGIAAPTTRLRG